MASMETKLLIGVLSQIEVGRIDYDGLAGFIGVDTSQKAGTSSKKNDHGHTKKPRRLVIRMESDEEEEVDDEEMNYDKESVGVEIKIEIPSRKLPYRRARATKFVEETSDAEDQQEEKEGKLQAKWKI